ncbi:hypothetical protein [Nonomuraea sp. WAC 01424]|nr:hypothetical protein [Nonomuraea sp. WAC 01424]
MKIRYEAADREFTHSACIEALNEISQRYGFPIPQQESERMENS